MNLSGASVGEWTIFAAWCFHSLAGLRGHKASPLWLPIPTLLPFGEGVLRKILTVGAAVLCLVTPLAAETFSARLLFALGIGILVALQPFRLVNHTVLIFFVALSAVWSPPGSASFSRDVGTVLGCMYVTAAIAKLNWAYCFSEGSTLRVLFATWAPRLATLVTSMQLSALVAIGSVIAEILVGVFLLVWGVTQLSVIAVVVLHSLLGRLGNMTFSVVVLFILLSTLPIRSPGSSEFFTLILLMAVWSATLAVASGKPWPKSILFLSKELTFVVLSSLILAIPGQSSVLAPGSSDALYWCAASMSLICAFTGVRTEGAFVMFSNFHPFKLRNLLPTWLHHRYYWVNLPDTVPVSLLREVNPLALLELRRHHYVLSASAARWLAFAFERHGSQVELRLAVLARDRFEPKQRASAPARSIGGLVPPLLPVDLSAGSLW